MPPKTLGGRLDVVTGDIDTLPHGKSRIADDNALVVVIHALDADTGTVTYGVGVSSNITRASVRAVFSGINRLGLGEKQQGISDNY